MHGGRGGLRAATAAAPVMVSVCWPGLRFVCRVPPQFAWHHHWYIAYSFPKIQACAQLILWAPSRCLDGKLNILSRPGGSFICGLGCHQSSITARGILYAGGLHSALMHYMTAVRSRSKEDDCYRYVRINTHQGGRGGRGSASRAGQHCARSGGRQFLKP